LKDAERSGRSLTSIAVLPERSAGNYINISHDDFITDFNPEPPEYEAAI